MSLDAAGLAAERDFLLRSLDDLDAERAAGDIDEATYTRLHADYTARAAAVVRLLEAGGDGPAAVGDAPRGPAPRRALVWAGIVAFAAVAAWLLTGALGERRPGQTATGNAQLSAEERRASLARAVEEEPRNYDARIAYARFLLGDDPLEALRQYDAAARLEPAEPEPKAYGGWVLGLAARDARGADRERLVAGALARLDAARRADPEYPDTHVFTGLVYFDVAGDAEAAVPHLRRYLLLAPADDPMREVVLGALAQAVQRSDAPPSTAPDAGPDTDPDPDPDPDPRTPQEQP